MKKIVRKAAIVLAAVLAFGAVLSGCKGKGEEDKVIRVGASPTPHAEILAVAKDILAEEGYTLEIVEFSDYVLPNDNLESGDLDANYFQHEAYLNQFNKEHGTHLVSVADVHYEPFGIYPGKTASLDELPDGATVAVPNDTSNEARALLFLQDLGLIELKEGVGTEATVIDITSNPKNLEIVEMEAAQLTKILPDVDVAVINGNYALQGGLNVVNDAIAIEDKDSDAIRSYYVNVIAVKEGHENDEKIQALTKAITDAKVRDFISETYNDCVIPMF